MRQIRYKVNKKGISTTPCPNGFKTFVGNRPKRAGDDCLMCKYREHVDYDNHVVICKYGKEDKKRCCKDGAMRKYDKKQMHKTIRRSSRMRGLQFGKEAISELEND